MEDGTSVRPSASTAARTSTSFMGVAGTAAAAAADLSGPRDRATHTLEACLGEGLHQREALRLRGRANLRLARGYCCCRRCRPVRPQVPRNVKRRLERRGEVAQLSVSEVIRSLMSRITSTPSFLRCYCWRPSCAERVEPRAGVEADATYRNALKAWPVVGGRDQREALGLHGRANLHLAHALRCCRRCRRYHGRCCRPIGPKGSRNAERRLKRSVEAAGSSRKAADCTSVRPSAATAARTSASLMAGRRCAIASAAAAADPSGPRKRAT
eukprot:scaffold36047_cov56-Phaeocystis_antarctica.AAC.2